mmetsp:Transcript_135012/g.336887  ORF Transcript_135012/g.336887 Transcript_135012/m.336887 type:complete len:201 (+) Transcript_135012:331-933(+)
MVSLVQVHLHGFAVTEFQLMAIPSNVFLHSGILEPLLLQEDELLALSIPERPCKQDRFRSGVHCDLLVAVIHTHHDVAVSYTYQRCAPLEPVMLRAERNAEVRLRGGVSQQCGPDFQMPRGSRRAALLLQRHLDITTVVVAKQFACLLPAVIVPLQSAFKTLLCHLLPNSRTVGSQELAQLNFVAASIETQEPSGLGGHL